LRSGTVFGQEDGELFERLFGKLDTVNNEKNALGIP
jgi:hypothetical protein